MMMTLPNAVAMVRFSAAVKDLGVVLESQLTMADHVAALSRSYFFLTRGGGVSEAVADNTGIEDISVFLYQQSN